MRRHLVIAAFFLVIAPLRAWSGELDCGIVSSQILMTWDYTDPGNWVPTGDAPQTRIKLVENVHFTPKVEQLIRGHTEEDPLGDISYTLTRFPNHTRALWALSRYWRMTGTEKSWRNYGDPIKRSSLIMAEVRGWPPTAECAFDRAIRFKPNDSAVRMVFGMHLHVTGKQTEALEQYKEAERLGLNSTEFRYNRGLLHFDMGNFDAARKDAQAAYAKGYPLPGLKDKLKGVGQWEEADATPKPAAKEAKAKPAKPPADRRGEAPPAARP